MKVANHICLSLPVSLIVYMVEKSTAAAVAAFIAGVFIDVDHVFDYLREYGLRVDSKLFFRTFRETIYKRLVLPFHAWEWLAVLGVVVMVFERNGIARGLLAGATLHLAADQVANKPSSFGYFFIYRIYHRFLTYKIIPGKGVR